jgi:hypothetical protein
MAMIILHCDLITGFIPSMARATPSSIVYTDHNSEDTDHSPNSPMASDFIFIPFDARKGEIADVISLLRDAGYVEDQLPSSKMSIILQRVHSKAGTIVQGYDEGDDFIDDSGIVALQNDQAPDPRSFRVVLGYGSAPSSKPPTPSARPEDSAGEPQVIPDNISIILNRIKLNTFEAIDRLAERQSCGARAAQWINFSNPVVEDIVNLVDEKIRYETEHCGGNPSKKKVEQWKKDAFQLIYSQCFTAGERAFTTLRKLAIAYQKFKKETIKDQGDADDETLKEPPVEPE